MTGLIWLTNIETAEPVGLPLSKVLLIEQKRPQEGGAVTFFLEHGKEVQATESLARICESIEAAVGGGSAQTPRIALAS